MVDLVKCGCGGTPSKPREVDKGDERRGYNFKAEITCTKCGIKVFGDSARDDLGWCNDTGQAMEIAVAKWNTALGDNCVAERDALKAELEKATRALESAGYTLKEGAQEWKPPLGPSASPMLDELDRLRAENEALKAEIEAALKQEPVAYRSIEKTLGRPGDVYSNFSRVPWEERGIVHPLYASPVPAQQPEAADALIERLWQNSNHGTRREDKDGAKQARRGTLEWLTALFSGNR